MPSLSIHCAPHSDVPLGAPGPTLAVGGTTDGAVGLVVDGVSVGAKYKVHSHSVCSC